MVSTGLQRASCLPHCKKGKVVEAVICEQSWTSINPFVAVGITEHLGNQFQSQNLLPFVLLENEVLHVF